MKTKLFINRPNFTAGITLKDDSEPENGNMAIHACFNTEKVIENRRNLAAFLHCELNNFVSSRQTHSANFYRVTKKDKGRGAVIMDDAIPDTDALYTYEPDLLLCCFTSDCVPVILYNERTGMTGVIHSGWQGTVKEITPKLLGHLIENEDCDPKALQVFIGPAISQDRFEVDRDVYDQFMRLGYADEYIRFDEETRKFHIDNQLVVKRQCEMHGIESSRILIDRTCTFDDPKCFSYRQDKNCGRHLSFIIRRSQEQFCEK